MNGPHVHVAPPAVPGAFGGGTGSPEDPFTSVADGIKKAQDGGTVYLHGGHYVESVALSRYRASTSTRDRGAAVRRRGGLHRLDAPRVPHPRT